MEWNRGKTLGKGGFASVYIATSNNIPHKTSLPPLMAVKSAKLSKPSSVRTLVNENYILKTLHQGGRTSPYIIGYHGSDCTVEQGEKAFDILLEYASMGSLRDRIKDYSVSCGCRIGLLEGEVKRYSSMILQGLKFIHDSGYVHCDIKLDNILLASSDSIRIADFGLAHHVGESTNTDLGSKGTPLYMAPESVRWHEYEAKADVWAFGCVVLEMLTGKLPWPEDYSSETLRNRIGFTTDLPLVPDEGLSMEARDFLSKCLVKETGDRWSIESLLCHPFVANTTTETCIREHKRVGGATSPRDPLDLPLSNCPSCVTRSGSIHSLHVISSTEDDGERGGKRRKIDVLQV